jgi:hypothetical protein
MTVANADFPAQARESMRHDHCTVIISDTSGTILVKHGNENLFWAEYKAPEQAEAAKKLIAKALDGAIITISAEQNRTIKSASPTDRTSARRERRAEARAARLITGRRFALTGQ